MKKLLLIAVPLVSLLLCCSRPQTTYNIQGKINNPELNGKTVYLYQQNKNGAYDQIDSTRIENNIFTFSGSQDSAQLGICLFDRRENIPFRPLTFVLENGTIKVVLDTVPTVGGTDLNNRLQTYFGKISDIEQQLNRLHARYTQFSSDTGTDRNMLAEIRDRGMNLMKESEHETESFIQANLDNIAGAFVFSISALNLDEAKAAAMLDSAGQVFRTNPVIRPIVRQFENKKRVQPGKPYVDLKMKKPTGEEIALSDLAGKGKYLVIDFWASWCPPCLESLPELIGVYKKYKDQLDVVGVSLDYSQEAWAAAVKNQNIPWTQMSDLKGWQSQAIDLYGFSAIPYLVLLDGEGTIVAKGLNVQTLQEKLDELLLPAAVPQAKDEKQ